MTRTKGSKNKTKQKNQQKTPSTSQNSAETSTEATNVSPSQNQETTPPEVETTPEVAPEPAAETAEPASDEPGIETHRAEPAESQESVPEMTARLCATIRKRTQKDSERKAAAAAYKEEIDRFDAIIKDLGSRIEEADLEEAPDYEAGVMRYRSKTTGQLVPGRDRPLLDADKQQELDFDRPSRPPRKETFSDLRDGKIWEHDQYGVVRILAVLEDSVRVQTENLDEPAEGIEIGRADWNGNDAHPREVPELAVGQAWVLSDTRATITALDDRAACCDVSTDQGDTVSDRRSRLQFCAAASRQLHIPELEVGRRFWLDENSGPVVEVKAIVKTDTEESVLVEYDDERQEQVPRGRFAGACLMQQKRGKRKVA